MAKIFCLSVHFISLEEACKSNLPLQTRASVDFCMYKSFHPWSCLMLLTKPSSFVKVWLLLNPDFVKVLSFLLSKNSVVLYDLIPLVFIWVIFTHKIRISYHTHTLSFFSGNPLLAPESISGDCRLETALVFRVQIPRILSMFFISDFTSTSSNHSSLSDMTPDLQVTVHMAFLLCILNRLSLPATAFLKSTTQSLKTRQFSLHYHEVYLHISLAGLL